MDHRPDCQLLTVQTYGLCTCDFDRRMANGVAKSVKVSAEELAAMPLETRLAFLIGVGKSL